MRAYAREKGPSAALTCIHQFFELILSWTVEQRQCSLHHGDMALPRLNRDVVCAPLIILRVTKRANKDIRRQSSQLHCKRLMRIGIIAVTHLQQSLYDSSFRTPQRRVRPVHNHGNDILEPVSDMSFEEAHVTDNHAENV